MLSIFLVGNNFYWEVSRSLKFILLRWLKPIVEKFFVHGLIPMDLFYIPIGVAIFILLTNIIRKRLL